MRSILPLAPAAAALLCANAAQAQVIDELDIRREGNDAVLQVRYSTEIQFQRAIATRSGDLVIVSYNLLTTTNAQLKTSLQALRQRADRGLPSMEISDEFDRGERGRRLVVRFSEATPAAVRAGRGNRSIEIVLRGKGAGLIPPVAAARPQAPPPAARAAAPQPPSAPPTPTSPPVAPAPAAPPRPAAQAPAPGPSPATPTPAPSRPATTGTVPATAPAQTVTPTPAPSAGNVPSMAQARGTPELEARAEALMKRARTDMAESRWAEALDALNQVLELPPTTFTREAQEQAGIAHLRLGDTRRARAEFETYLRLFPQGADSDRVRAALAALPTAEAPPPVAVTPARRPEKDVTMSGSVSATYYGGNGQVRSRDFQDSPISGLPELAGDPQLNADRNKQLYTDVDFNWRRRNTEVDQRFVLRDSYSSDLIRSDKSKNRLSALYFDHKSIPGGWGLRVGRQSPTGGGVMSRFDGLSATYAVRPRIKLGAVAGVPTERFFDSRRRFAGVSVDADRLVGNLGGGLFLVQQQIDGEVDRRAIGFDLRWFQGGTTVFSQFDYDVLMRGLNVATVQGTMILADNTVLNALYDRRALTTLTLGNALTFSDTANPGVLFRRIQDRLAGTTVDALRDQIKRSTPMVTQAQIGITKPWNKNWQTGASVQLTNTGAIPPVPEVAGFEQGRPATGNVITTSAQLIGLNLYSARDTHVLSTSVISSPTLKGLLVAYNNSSFVAGEWQVEPSLQFYRDRSNEGNRSQRWTPGLRITYRGWQHWAMESNLSYEFGTASRLTPDATGTGGGATTTEESTRRVTYSLGARYEF